MPVDLMPPNVEIMKKASNKRSRVSSRRASASDTERAVTADEMRPHYDFDYSKSRPNRFSDRLADDTVAIVLDPDVAAVFRSSEAVNAFLRSAISAMPSPGERKRKRSA